MAVISRNMSFDIDQNIHSSYQLVVLLTTLPHMTDWLPGATTHVGSRSTQEDASNHLSLALILQFLISNFSASLITPSIHLRFSIPTCLQPSGLSKVIFLHGMLSCIRTICPTHLNLVILTVVTRSVSSYRQYSSSLYLDLYVASSQMGPQILLTIFLSKTPRRDSSALLRIQFSAPYIRTGLINVLCMVNLCFLFMFSQFYTASLIMVERDYAIRRKSRSIYLPNSGPGPDILCKYITKGWTICY